DRAEGLAGGRIDVLEDFAGERRPKAAVDKGLARDFDAAGSIAIEVCRLRFGHGRLSISFSYGVDCAPAMGAAPVGSVTPKRSASAAREATIAGSSTSPSRSALR